MAMADGEPEKPQALVDVANRMGRSANSLSMMRRSLIKKGMIYSPKLGMVAYTVPMFGAYMRRISGMAALHTERPHMESRHLGGIID